MCVYLSVPASFCRSVRLPQCQACNSRLTPGAQLDHQDLPYCKSCFEKNFRPKGFHAGGTTDSFVASPKQVDAASPHRPAPTDAAVAASIGGGSGASAAASPSAGVGGKYCTKCGEIKKAGAKFCGQCGTPA
jgi:hypothetical protein